MQRNMLSTFLIAIALLGLLSGAALAETDTRKVAILPFDAADAGKYSQLKDGLKSMLSGRLAAKDEVEVIDADLSEEEQQRIAGAVQADRQAVFSRLDADHIAKGRMVYAPDTLRIVMTLYAADGQTPLEVQVEAEGDHQILPAMDLLVLKIGEEILGVPKDGSPAETAVARTGMEAFQTEHPERKYKEEIISGSSVSAEGEVVIARGDLVRRRSAIDGKIISLTTEDVDDDGIDEIFVVTPNDLRVYHYTKGLLEQLDTFDFPASLEVHAVNIADINMDGLSEIYLSAVDSNRFSSMVLMWSAQNGFRAVMEDIGYGIRPLDLPGEGVVLAGQAKTMMNDSFLKPGIFRLQVNWQNKTFMPGSPLTLPKEVNLFDFVLADLDSDGMSETIAITRDMKMVVYGHDNRMLWQSEENYGGSTRYLGSRWREDNDTFSRGSFESDAESSQKLEYLPIQLQVADGNGDGDLDILSAGNEPSLDEVLKFFPNLRSFSAGKVVCLTWENGGMKKLWETETLNGHVTGFDFVIRQESGTAQGEGEEVRLVVGHTPGSELANLLSFGGDQDALLIYNFKIQGKSGMEEKIESN